jgi:hypothetical protein
MQLRWKPALILPIRGKTRSKGQNLTAECAEGHREKKISEFVFFSAALCALRGKN